MYYDSNGLIVQKDLDGGDTAGREGDYWFAQALYGNGPNGLTSFQRDEFTRVLMLLQASPGVFIRNPDDYNDPTDFSRDQTIPIILALGEMERYDILKELMLKQIKRFTLYQNHDLATPQDLNYYIRAFRAWYLYPFVFIGDFFLLTNSIIRCIVGGMNRDDVSDDINHTIVLIQAQHHLPTPISWLARKVYKWLRPQGVQRAWDWYFRPETGANEFNEIYRDLISKL